MSLRLIIRPCDIDYMSMWRRLYAVVMLIMSLLWWLYIPVTLIKCHCDVDYMSVWCDLDLWSPRLKTTIQKCVSILSGLASHVYRFSTTFPTLIAITVFIGIFIGSRGPINSLMCLEVVGTKKMPQAYSISSMLCTFVAASSNPILGKLRS